MADSGGPSLRAFGRAFRARQAARLRLPAWLRLLMPVMGMAGVVGLTAGSVALLWSLHRALHPGISLRTASGPAMLLMVFASMIASAPAAFLLVNVLIRSVPPLRRVLDENSKGVPGASYQASMRRLRRAALVTAPPALILALVGTFEPWAR